MIAAVVEKPGMLVIKELPRPKPSAGEFLIRVEAAAICNATDNHILNGCFEGSHDRYPQVLGHEVCGIVEEVASDLCEPHVGQRVALYTNYGAFQEYVIVSRKSYYAFVPDTLTPEEGAICEMMDGSYSSLVAPTLLKKNDIVLVVGAGPIGLTAIGMAALEAGKVIAVDFYKNRLEMAKEFGAAFVYNRSEMSVTDILQAIKSDVGEVDVTYMCIALDQSKELDAFHLAVEATRIDGRIAGVNVEVKPQRHNHYLNPFHMNKKNIKYRHYLERGRDTSDFQKGFNQVGKGLFPIKKMITHHVTLDKLAWALDMTHNHLGECIKIIVYPRME